MMGKTIGRKELIFLAGIFGSSVAQDCTLCADGSVPTLPEGMIGQIACNDLNLIIGNTPESSTDCRDLRLQAYMNCGCPTFPDDFCPMCPNGEFDIEFPDREIPIFNDETCQESLFKLKTETDSICDDVQRADHYCGCPNATPPVCQFCEDGSAPPNSDLVLPSAFTLTCERFAIVVGFGKGQGECNGLIGMPPVNTRAYCGCTDTSPPVDPPICPRLCENELPDPSRVVSTPLPMTCQDVSDLAPFIDDAEYCDTFLERFGGCCSGTDTPTVALTPTSAPTVIWAVAPTPSPTSYAESVLIDSLVSLFSVLVAVMIL